MSDFVIGTLVMLIGIPLTAYVTIHTSHSSTKEEALGALSNISKKALFLIIISSQFIALYFFAAQIYEVIANIDGPAEKQDLARIALSVGGFCITFSHLAFLASMMLIRSIIDINKSQAGHTLKLLSLIEDLAVKVEKIDERQKT